MLGSTGRDWLGIFRWGARNPFNEVLLDDDRPTHMDLFDITCNMDVLAGSLMEPVIGDLAGLQVAMVIGGVGLKI